MAILHLVCGLPGSGKTTLAARLAETDGTIWLSPDRWLLQLDLGVKEWIGLFVYRWAGYTPDWLPGPEAAAGSANR